MEQSSNRKDILAEPYHLLGIPWWLTKNTTR